jgi:hypothetical protein
VSLIRIDPHAHLYDCYPLVDWVDAAIRNLQGSVLNFSPNTELFVVVVDRIGQDCFARFRSEVHSFGAWSENSAQNPAVLGVVTYNDRALRIIRGVQYVTAERLEVLGLGVVRTIDDGASFNETIEAVRASGGFPCIPWSPGKWLGARGVVVSNALDSYLPGELLLGDISMRSKFGPPSRILARAKRAGFTVIAGSDPLPRVADIELVGSYGVQFVFEGPSDQPQSVLESMLKNSNDLTAWGRPNFPILAIRRFIATV